MDFSFKKRLITLFLCLLLLSCDNKRSTKIDVLFVLEDFQIEEDSSLSIKLINNSDNYYVTLDTNRTYNYAAFDHKRNNSVILKPLVYSDGRLYY